MRDILKVHRLLGLSPLSMSERMLVYDALKVVSGSPYLHLPAEHFLCAVLNHFSNHRKSLGRRKEIKRLIEKLMEIGGDDVRVS